MVWKSEVRARGLWFSSSSPVADPLCMAVCDLAAAGVADSSVKCTLQLCRFMYEQPMHTPNDSLLYVLPFAGRAAGDSQPLRRVRCLFLLWQEVCAQVLGLARLAVQDAVSSTQGEETQCIGPSCWRHSALVC
jgi:hypothetical protein